jgi:hypothetical protein
MANGEHPSTASPSVHEHRAVATGDPKPSLPAPVSQRFRCIPCLEFLQQPAPKWIIRNLLPESGLVVVFGESGSGKSFVALDLAMAIARGEPWRGHAVRQGQVVYVAAEGAGGFRNRLIAYRRHFNMPADKMLLGVIPDSPNLLQKEDTQALVNSLACVKPTAVFIDTLNQVMPGGNENSSEDMGRVLGHCRSIGYETGALIVLIHHAGKDASKGARGWSGLRAAADAEIEISRHNENRIATVTKLKDGGDGAKYPFRLAVVPIDIDDRGDIVDSCVVEHVDTAEAKNWVRKPAKQRVKGANEELIMEAYQELTLIGDSVRVEDLIATAKARRKNQRNARQHLKRAIETLEARKFLRVDQANGTVQLAQ